MIVVVAQGIEEKVEEDSSICSRRGLVVIGERG